MQLPDNIRDRDYKSYKIDSQNNVSKICVIEQIIPIAGSDGSNNVQVHVNADGDQVIAVQENNSYSPNPLNPTTGEYISPSVDNSGRLETHSTVLSDEGSLRDDFIGSSLTTNLTGTITFTNGSTTLTGTGTIFKTEVKNGSYIKKISDSESNYVRVSYVQDDTTIILESSYSGSTQTTTAHKSNFKTFTSGAGASLSVSSSLVNIIGSTASGTFTGIQRIGDYGPYQLSFKASISQRIANQTINIGAQDTFDLSPGVCAIFQFTGTSNTQVTCISSSSSSPSDTQSSIVSIPANSNTSAQNRYEINVSNNQVTFLINGYIVAIHQDHIPGPYDSLFLTSLISNAAVVTASTVAIDWVLFYNLNQAEFTNSFLGEPIRTQQPELLQAYSASVVGLVVAASATDIFTITGSSSKTIRVRKIEISGTRGTATQTDIIVLKRSTSNTGGTSTTLKNVPLDSANQSSTAVVRSYTANPTLGTLIGNIKASKIPMGVAAPGNAQSSIGQERIYEFGRQSVVLRGTSEVVSINLNGQTVAGSSINISIEWTEE